MIAQGGRGGHGRSSWNAGPNVSVEDFDFGGAGAGGWNDIFEQVFSGGGRPGGLLVFDVELIQIVK